MKIKKIKDLKPGEFFTLHDFGDEPSEEHVYIRRGYDREWKMYCCDKFDNISEDLLFNGDKRVYTDFTFTRSVVSYNPYSNTYEINKQFDPENKEGEKECQE